MVQLIVVVCFRALKFELSRIARIVGGQTNYFKCMTMSIKSDVRGSTWRLKKASHKQVGGGKEEEYD